MSDTLTSEIRRLLNQHGGLSVDAGTLGVNDDLYSAGMSSFAAVDVMLALEDEFGITFPDEMLKPELLQSIRSIAESVATLPSSSSA
jgi:acyl carrier protein